MVLRFHFLQINLDTNLPRLAEKVVRVLSSKVATATSAPG